MGRKHTDYTGQRFNHLTGIRFIRKLVRDCDKTRSDSEWLWLCDCGQEFIKNARYVKRDFVKSCGCHVNYGWRSVAHHVYRHYHEENGITQEDFIKMSQLPCHYCGLFRFNKRKINNNYWEYHGLDRIDSDLGHTKENCVPCCWRCNQAKSNYHRDDFLQWVEQIYLNQKKKST
jgi:hypothetical protein